MAFNLQKKMAFNPNKIFLSSLLTAVLVLPYLGSLSHLFEDHDHKTCEISKIHLHELDLDCDILEYQFAPSLEISFETDFAFIYASQQKKFPFFNEGDSFSIDIHHPLRGPPKV